MTQFSTNRSDQADIDAVAEPKVCVAIATYNHARFLAQAIDSVLAQTRPVDEIIVVDDGSSDDPGAVTALYPSVRLIRQKNQGPSAARNTAIKASTAQFILFLDADDRLKPRCIAAGLEQLNAAPECVLSYGGYVMTDGQLQRMGEPCHVPIGDHAYRSLLHRNVIGMVATVLFRRPLLEAEGGFDASLRGSEDYELYLRLARRYPFVSYPEVVAEYRWHGGNTSRNDADQLRWALKVLDSQIPFTEDDATTARALRQGREHMLEYYISRMLPDAKSNPARLIHALKASPAVTTRRIMWGITSRLRAALPGSIQRWADEVRGKTYRPAFGKVRMGDLDRVIPVSDMFGYDRGTPVDRYYIENWLEKRKADIHGRVLEIGDATYCERFGGDRVVQQDVLHIHEGNPVATLVGDMSEPGVLPSDSFDCMVLTQTLQFIYDMRAAVREAHRALKPGGVMLVTVPGISPIERGNWGVMWFWALTTLSATRMFSEQFGAENIEVETFGNIYAATSFLQGMALEEVDHSKLQPVDLSYPVIIAVRARKPA